MAAVQITKGREGLNNAFEIHLTQQLHLKTKKLKLIAQRTVCEAEMLISRPRQRSPGIFRYSAAHTCSGQQYKTIFP